MRKKLWKVLRTLLIKHAQMKRSNFVMQILHLALTALIESRQNRNPEQIGDFCAGYHELPERELAIGKSAKRRLRQSHGKAKKRKKKEADWF